MVAAGTTAEPVVPGIAEEVVTTLVAHKEIRTAIPKEPVVADVAGESIDTGATFEEVVPRTAADDVVASAAPDEVIAAAGRYHVGPVRADDRFSLLAVPTMVATLPWHLGLAALVGAATVATASEASSAALVSTASVRRRCWAIIGTGPPTLGQARRLPMGDAVSWPLGATLNPSSVSPSSTPARVRGMRRPLPCAMTDHDAELDAILEQVLDAARMVEIYTDADGQDAMMAASLDE